MPALETQTRLNLTVLDGRMAVVPCGHVEDAIGLEATESFFAYCSRCERGFHSPLVPA